MMKKSLLILAGLIIGGPCVAETYDFEIGAQFGSVDGGGATAATNFLPATSGSSSSDEIALFGTWFYDGLSDEKGPRSRAAFLSRSSGVTLQYSSSDSDTSNTVPGPFGPITVTSGSETSTFALDVRHYFGDEGWFITGGYARSDFDITFDGGTISGFADSFSADVLSAGVGKFIADRTSVEIGIARIDGEGESDTSFAASISHIGDLDSGWQWGGDAGIGIVDSDNRSYSGRVLLYPNRDFAFGVGLTLTDQEFSVDTTNISAEVDWFVSPTTSLRAEVFRADIDAGDIDSDADGFTVGFRMRF